MRPTEVIEMLLTKLEAEAIYLNCMQFPFPNIATVMASAFRGCFRLIQPRKSLHIISYEPKYVFVQDISFSQCCLMREFIDAKHNFRQLLQLKYNFG